MKLIIDIPEERYKHIQEEQWLPNRLLIEKAIANGIPIPDNATNGDVLKIVFMPNRITRTDDDTVHIDYDFTPEWWNAPYQKGGKE